MTARRAAAALAAILAAAPAAAYVRTTAAGTGKELFWPEPAVPWRLNRDWPHTAPSCQASGGADPTLDAIRTSFAAWEQSCANLRLVYAGNLDEIRTGLGGMSENVVVFRRGWCSQNPAATADPCFLSADGCAGIYDCFDDGCGAGVSTCAAWATVALTSVIYDPDSGRIMDADIELSGWDGGGGGIGSTPRHGWYFTCVDPSVASTTCSSYGQADCHFIDLQNTVTHEAGHFIGLAHPCGGPTLPACTAAVPAGDVPFSDRTMSPTTQVGETLKRSLSADDIAGVCAIYPQPSGGCGCASGTAGGTLALLLAGLALRRGSTPRPRKRALRSP